MNPHQQVVEQIIDEIQKHHSFCVVGHVRPDGDCIGSQLGLGLALSALGKEVAVWNEDPIPTKLAFLDPQKWVQKPRRNHAFDCVIATDCASFERLGRVGEFIGERKLFINIDHHQSNTRYADINWVSECEPSTGELIFKLLRAAKWPVTREIADCLFTAVSTDTGSFQYPSTLPETYQIGGELVGLGANLARICDEVYQSSSLSRVRLLRHVYNNFKLTHSNQVAYLWLRKRDFGRTGAEPADTEGIIDHLRSIEPVVVACVFEEIEPDLTRISLRSKHADVNVSTVACQFGGGGHSAAAGARIQGSSLSVQRRVIRAVKTALDRVSSHPAPKGSSKS